MLCSSATHATVVLLGSATPLLDHPALTNPFPPNPAMPDTLDIAAPLVSIAFPGSPAPAGG